MKIPNRVLKTLVPCLLVTVSACSSIPKDGGVGSVQTLVDAQVSQQGDQRQRDDGGDRSDRKRMGDLLLAETPSVLEKQRQHGHHATQYGEGEDVL